MRVPARFEVAEVQNDRRDDQQHERKDERDAQRTIDDAAERAARTLEEAARTRTQCRYGARGRLALTQSGVFELRARAEQGHAVSRRHTLVASGAGDQLVG